MINNFSHKNLDEYVDNRQEIDNLPDIELWTVMTLIALVNYVLLWWLSIFPY